MKLRLNYVLPNGEVVNVNHVSNFDHPGTVAWLYNMVESNPDTIFFFTADTTDIWGMRML